MTLDYFYGQTGELFSFYRIPKALFQEQRFQSLSTDAKTLYGILLDRMSLSAKNGWLDEQNRVFIIFTIEDVKRSLCCADNKATKLLRELEEFGLIERKRRGLGRPSLVYVKNFSADSSKTRFQNRENHESGGFKSASQDPAKPRCNKTDKNNTEMNETYPFNSEETDGMSQREQLEKYFSQSLEVELLLRLCPDDEDERSVRSTAEAENRLPLNIHGKSLLAGNAYCGHCGAKLELTSSRKWRKMADGSLDDTLRIRYTCYGKLRKQTNCTGQTGYTVHILDEIIDKAVRQIFSKMRGIPKEQIVTKRYEKENAERKNHLQDLQTQRNKAEKDLLALKTEVLACIKGESVLPRETLAEMITAQEEKLTELENLCEAASEELEKTAELMDKVSRLYDELISYADLYDSANFEAKKMIVNQLIRRVDVYRGYQINISFNFDLTPYIEGE